MTVAARVAEEVGTDLGEQVGYSIRFEEVCTQVCPSHLPVLASNMKHQPLALCMKRVQL